MSEADSHSESREITRLLWNPKGHYCVHKSPSLDHILSHSHPLHKTLAYFLKIHYDIIFPSTPRSSQVVSSTQVFQQSIICITHTNIL